VEARTGLVIGGVTAVAASIAVVTAVAVANTMALKDSPGTSLASESVVVPSTTSPSASPRATPTATLEAAPPAAAEVVEAPAPLVVQPPFESDAPSTSVAPADPPASATAPDAPPPAPATDIDSVIAAAKASGSWDELRAWTKAQGWTTARIDALVSRLERELAEKSPESSNSAELSEAPVLSDPTTQRDSTTQLRQVQAEAEYVHQTTSEPVSVGKERPAHAGSNVGNGNGAGHDAKKDQSRNSPDKRD
jgi:hypothetical protein